MSSFSSQILICSKCEEDAKIPFEHKCQNFDPIPFNQLLCRSCGHKKSHHNPPPPPPKVLNAITLPPAYCLSCQLDSQIPSNLKCPAFKHFSNPEANQLCCSRCGHDETQHKILDPVVFGALEQLDQVIEKQNQVIKNQNHQIEKQNQQIEKVNQTNQQIENQNQQIKHQNQQIENQNQQFKLELEKVKNQNQQIENQNQQFKLELEKIKNQNQQIEKLNQIVTSLSSEIEKLNKNQQSTPQFSSHQQSIPHPQHHLLNPRSSLAVLNAHEILPSSPKAQIDSQIVVNNSDVKLLFEWTHAAKFSLLYRASRDGFGAEYFHSKCDDKGSTLTIVKDENGNIFGGFTKVPWTSPVQNSPINNWKADSYAFLFTLKNNQNVKQQIFKIKNDWKNKALFHDKNRGPGFGYNDLNIFGRRIYLSLHQNSSSNSHSELDPNSDDNYYENLTGNKYPLTGQRLFTVDDCEVFLVV